MHDSGMWMKGVFCDKCLSSCDHL